MRKMKYLTLAALILVFTICHASDTTDYDDDEEDDIEEEVNEEPEEEVDDEEESSDVDVKNSTMKAPDNSDSNEQEELVKINNLLAFLFYKKISQKISKNFVYSPILMLSNILTLLEASTEDTAKELLKLLSVDDQNTLGTELDELLHIVKKETLFSLKTLTNFYVNKNINVKRSYRSLASKKYDVSIVRVNFANKSGTAARINKWVEDSTQIKKFVDPKKLNDQLQSILISISQMTATWDVPFAPPATTNEIFKIQSGPNVLIKCMKQYNNFEYGESSELRAKFLQLHFGGSSGSVVYVLPQEFEDLAMLENKIENVLSFNQFTEERLQVSLPKFQLKSKLDFKNTLLDLGISKIFDKNLSSFNHLTNKKNNFAINRIIQEVLISISEEGISATPNNKTYFATQSITAYEAKKMYINKPFLFYIKIDDIIVYIGRIANPGLL